MRTRSEVETEMLAVVADAQAAGASRDEISVELDHHRLNELISEWEAIPLQRAASGTSLTLPPRSP